MSSGDHVGIVWNVFWDHVGMSSGDPVSMDMSSGDPVGIVWNVFWGSCEYGMVCLLGILWVWYGMSSGDHVRMVWNVECALGIT